MAVCVPRAPVWRLAPAAPGKYPPVPTRYSTPLRSLVDSMLKQNPKVGRRDSTSGNL